jgi:hypothetical protein
MEWFAAAQELMAGRRVCHELTNPSKQELHVPHAQAK